MTHEQRRQASEWVSANVAMMPPQICRTLKMALIDSDLAASQPKTGCGVTRLHSDLLALIESMMDTDEPVEIELLKRLAEICERYEEQMFPIDSGRSDSDPQQAIEASKKFDNLTCRYCNGEVPEIDSGRSWFVQGNCFLHALKSAPRDSFVRCQGRSGARNHGPGKWQPGPVCEQRVEG